MCILYDNKVCDDCGECNMCDLEPSKVCDSCGKCINSDEDYSVYELDMNIEYTDSRDDFAEGELDDFDDSEYSDDEYDGYDDYDDIDDGVIYDDYDEDYEEDDDDYKDDYKDDDGGYFGLDDFRR